MNKKIVTENELNELVKDATIQVLNEMALPIKLFKTRVDGLRLQLIQNWCLCKYCQLYCPENENFNHWVSELKAHMDNIKSLNVKKGNKLTILNKMFIDDYDFNDVNTIYRIIVGKFKRENIMDVNIISKISTCFANSINDFINALGIDTIITEDYLKNAFDLS